MITVFTSTYNRAKELSKLYRSLIKQTYKDFEWLIIDDGSEDNTSHLIHKMKSENKIKIEYVHKENGGKHRAINLGVKLAKGELFFIVDSDDFLPEDSLENICFFWNNIKNKKAYGGLTFRKFDIKQKRILGKKFDKKIFDSNHIDLENMYGAFDKAEVFSTEILKKYPFPEIENEKFVPEGYIWTKISLDYKMKYIDKIIYFCEYLDDGYTKNFKKNFKKNPKGFRISYLSILKNKKYKIIKKIKSLVRVLQSYYYEYLKKLIK
jgi:glycosyltransferase involved in cell wall biosynthesis